MSLERFHAAVAAWFRAELGTPTPAQAQAWPAILDGRHTLIAAPTGSGKTLAAFLAAVDGLVRQGLAGKLGDETQVVYVSPLKALSNDIQRNLEAPLAGIAARLRAQRGEAPEIRTLVRTGDTPQEERARMRRRPPHIIVTTPESLYVLLTSDSGRGMLRSVRTVIVDEIHALAGNKRGAHLALSLERLGHVTGKPLTRIGLSATQSPMDEIARFLVGASDVRAGGAPDCAIIDTGHVRGRDLAIEVPGAPLEAVMSGEVWEMVYDRLAELIREHRTTLVFVNTRRLAERVARHLAERLGDDAVTSHHGSLSKERRLDAEARLKSGSLKALVATASLELGIDIGFVELACQISSPRSIATFVQRIGRSGRGLAATPKGRLFPLSRDDLVECTAILEAVRGGELDRILFHPKPLDALTQQIVAEIASEEWDENALYECFRKAWPYRDVTRDEFQTLVRMVAEGYATQRGRRGAYVHRDAVNGQLRARRGARLAALTSGGTIPDTADYQVVLEPAGMVVGTLNEDFAIESLAGDVFQLGNHSYRILRVETGRVRVEDAAGQPPSIPFWLGEAPARTQELSAAVSRLRRRLSDMLRESPDGTAARAWLIHDLGLSQLAASQLVEYLAAARAAFGGVLPDQHTIVLERFFDESGGMQLVVHSPFGGRINRAWGLALRKRFCRKFNFELQAAATEDAIIISLTTLHSFPLEEVARYLHPQGVRDILTQALLAAPMFTTRWRWNVTTALAVLRMRGGKKTPPQLARMQAEDLIAQVFPDQIACFENLKGDREVPDHPLVNQTLYDCLHDAMDIEGLERLLTRIFSGEVKVLARDLTEPSPFAAEVLTAQPYAFLDDAPLEERRTHAVQSRRWLDPQTAGDLGRLDADAVARVREEAWPEPQSADESHDALMTLGFVTEQEGRPWRGYLDALVGAGRVTKLGICPGEEQMLWVAVERLPLFRALHADVKVTPEVDVPAEFAAQAWDAHSALIELFRGRLEGLGPVTVAELATPLQVAPQAAEAALMALAAQGFVMRGRYRGDIDAEQWCDRRLLARIHRYTLTRLRREIEPVTSQDFIRFLCHWQRVTTSARGEGPDALAAVIAQLDGYEASAAAWEGDILPARIADYEPSWLDALCLAGRALWLRLPPAKASSAGPMRSTPVAFVSRGYLSAWQCTESAQTNALPTGNALRAYDYLSTHGASFFDEIAEGTGLLKTQIEEALAELAASGRARADSFSGLRAMLLPADKRPRYRGSRTLTSYGVADAGRWSLIKRSNNVAQGEEAMKAVETIARALLRRYGVVFRKLVEREFDQLPPWRELLWAYRRLEARGEIRGGRFVAGFAGEQYALPEAVTKLRDLRRAPHDADEWISLSAADPLNLIGILTPGARVPALATNRVLYRDGLPVAVQVAGEIKFLQTLDPTAAWQAKNALLRRAAPAPGARAYLHRAGQ